MATGNMHRKFREVFERTDRQTDMQTRSSQYFALLPMGTKQSFACAVEKA